VPLAIDPPPKQLVLRNTLTKNCETLTKDCELWGKPPCAEFTRTSTRSLTVQSTRVVNAYHEFTRNVSEVRHAAFGTFAR